MMPSPLQGVFYCLQVVFPLVYRVSRYMLNPPGLSGEPTFPLSLFYTQQLWIKSNGKQKSPKENLRTLVRFKMGLNQRPPD